MKIVAVADTHLYHRELTVGGWSSAEQRWVPARERITFRTKSGKTAMVDPLVFLDRFVEHVLPSGFVKIRHYGLLAPSHVGSELALARAALAASSQRSTVEREASDDWRALLAQLTSTSRQRFATCT